jgi:tetratricopeptide (TPR) repeat protein
MQRSCPSCGAETFAGARFCRRCGAPLHAGAGDATGEVSPQAATVPLVVEGRTTHGFAPEDEHASAETSRVSRAEIERLLRSQQDSGRHGPEPESNAPQLVSDTLAEERPQHATAVDGLARPIHVPGTHDPDATLVNSSANTRPGTSHPGELEDELTVSVPRPVRPLETRETTTGFGQPMVAPPAQAAHAARETDAHGAAFMPSAATRESAPFPGLPADEGASAQAPDAAHAARPAVAPTRRKWPVVATVCGALLLFAVVAAFVGWRLLRRPAPPVVLTQEPSVPAADPKQQFEEKLAEAESLLAQGDMDAAAARLREANALDPSNTRAHKRLGELLLAGGARREAIEEFRAAARNAPEDFDAWRQLASAQFAEGLYADAAESYRRLVALVGEAATDPNDLLSYADALRLSGHVDEARALYQRLASTASSDVASVARQRLAELAQAQPTPAPSLRPGESASQPRGGETASITSPGTAAQPAPPQPTPAAQPTPAPAATARPAEVSPAEHYRRGVELWSSNRATALEEFRAAAGGGNADAHYYLGLGYVEGRNLHALKRAEVVAALEHFQRAERGQFAEQSRRYAQQLENEFDRLRK